MDLWRPGFVGGEATSPLSLDADGCELPVQLVELIPMGIIPLALGEIV